MRRVCLTLLLNAVDQFGRNKLVTTTFQLAIMSALGVNNATTTYGYDAFGVVFSKFPMPPTTESKTTYSGSPPGGGLGSHQPPPEAQRPPTHT
jgi:hypothetical protein